MKNLIRPGEGAQLKDAISFRIQREAKNNQPLGKSLLKLSSVLHLNGKGPFPIRVAGLPLVYGGRYQNPCFDSVYCCRAPIQNRADPG